MKNFYFVNKPGTNAIDLYINGQLFSEEVKPNEEEGIIHDLIVYANVPIYRPLSQEELDDLFE